MKRIIITGLMITGLLMLLLACEPATPPADSGATDNKTGTTNTTLEKGAQPGDLVEINYVLKLENGTVVSTNDEELAKKHGLKNYVKGHYKFILGQSGIVPGFDTVITGMKPGQHREAMIEPSEPEIIIPLNRTMIQERFLRLSRYQKFPTGTYRTLFLKEPVIGDVVHNQELQFKYQIINKTDKYALGKIIAKEGEEYMLKNTEWPSEVLRVTEEELLFAQKPEENTTFETPFGTAKAYTSKSRLFVRHDPEANKIFNKSMKVKGSFGVDQQFQVTEIEEDYFVIKRYGLLTDKRLQLSVDLLNLTKEVKDVKKTTPIPFVSIGGGTEN